MSVTVHRVQMALVVIVEPAPHGLPGFVFRVELDGRDIGPASPRYNTEADALLWAKKVVPALAKNQIDRAERRVTK